MSTKENVQIVKDFFAAIGAYNKQDLLALVAADIEWIIPGEGWPLAGTYRGHAELATVLQKASEEIETTYPTPPEFLAWIAPSHTTRSSNAQPLRRSRCTTKPGNLS